MEMEWAMAEVRSCSRTVIACYSIEQIPVLLSKNASGIYKGNEKLLKVFKAGNVGVRHQPTKKWIGLWISASHANGETRPECDILEGSALQDPSRQVVTIPSVSE